MILAGDCCQICAGLPGDLFDSVVTDPPYELGFMGRAWDRSGVAFDPATWAAFLRVAKPGAHLVAFGGSRTYHRIACAIEDAGWEIRDSLQWLYGTGFPKSLDVSKAIDAAAGEEREIVGSRRTNKGDSGGQTYAALGEFQQSRFADVTAPATDLARQWDGWGTALKPAFEPVVLARKPLVGTVAANVERYGTGGINVDGCRIEGEERPAREHTGRSGAIYGSGLEGSRSIGTTSQGRWPANVLLDEAAAAMLGEPARFFYCAKASRAEREAGLDALPLFTSAELTGRKEGSAGSKNPRASQTGQPRHNRHPTVKPLDLMRWLVRLVTPPGGLVLDPFAGSGTTGLACRHEGAQFVGIEQEPEFAQLASIRAGAALHRVATIPAWCVLGQCDCALF